MTERVFDAVLHASWQAAAIGAVVLILQVIVGRWISPRARMALWGLVLLRLALPVTPGSAWSLFNLAQREEHAKPQAAAARDLIIKVEYGPMPAGMIGAQPIRDVEVRSN